MLTGLLYRCCNENARGWGESCSRRGRHSYETDAILSGDS